MSIGRDVSVWMDDVQRVPQGHAHGIASREGNWNEPIHRDMPPYITEIDPPVGTPVLADSILSFRAVYPWGAKRAVIAVRMGQAWDLVYDGAGFSPLYQDSVVEALSDGWRFRVRRRGGWTSAPTLWPLAYDVFGNEAP